MQAIIWKTIDGADYFYGKYKFDTPDEQNYVNVLAESVRDMEGSPTWVERIEDGKED